MVADAARILEPNVFSPHLIFNRGGPIIRSPPIINLMEFMDIPNDLCNFVDMLEICDTGLDSIQCSFDGLWLFAGYI